MDINSIKNHFVQKGWHNLLDQSDVIFSKSQDFDKCSDLDIILPGSGLKKNSVYDFDLLFQKFMYTTKNYFEGVLGKLDEMKPLNIYNGYNGNSFVSTGLEYYYDYFYRDGQMYCKDSPTIVIQPVVRFRMDFFDEDNCFGNNKSNDYSGIAFNNVSIVTADNGLDLVDKIEIFVDYLSAIKIHASRVRFVVESDTKYKDNNVSYEAVKFFVDNLEIGDILSFSSSKGNITEFGLGFERLFSRISNRKFKDVYVSTDSYDTKSVLAVNFLTLLSYYNENEKTRGARSKINYVLKAMGENKSLFDISLIKNNYNYWQNFVPYNSSNNFDSITDRYLNMVRRR